MAKVLGLLFSKTSFFKNLGSSSTTGYPPNTGGNNGGASAEIALKGMVEVPFQSEIMIQILGMEPRILLQKKN
jgi:hypothetical protein